MPTRRSRAGAVLLIALVAGGSTGCEFLKGRPDVDHVDVSVNPPKIAEGQSAQAAGVPRKSDGSAISSSKVHVTYSSSDASIATVNPSTGVVTGVAAGTALIYGESQGKRGSDSIEVVLADPATILRTPASDLQLTVGASTTLTLDPKGANGLSLPGRTATFVSSDARVATVTSTGPLTARVTGIGLGNAQITGTIGTRVIIVPVLVRTPAVATAGLALQTGKTELQVGESIQAVLTLRDSAGNTLPLFGHTLAYTSTDLTVATVNAATGVVTAVKEGPVQISVTVDNNAVGQLKLQVIPKIVKDLRFGVPSVIFRVGGGPRNLAAIPLDSAGKAVDRPVSYKSTNESVAQVNGSGLVTPRSLGTAQIVASIDALTDTMTVQVTPMPITSVRVEPAQATALVGETRQYTATLFDSLGVQVTGRTVTWLSNNTQVATVSSSGLATARQPGNAQVQAFTDVVPGFATRVGGAAELIVSATPVARLEVAPASVTVKAGARTQVVIRAFDAAGNELFNRATSIVARPADPSIATGDGAGNVVGLAQGQTTIVYQAVDTATGLAQGSPATLTVNVN